MKAGSEVNEIENKYKTEKINEAKSSFFENINKLIKKRERKTTYITNFRKRETHQWYTRFSNNEKEGITPNSLLRTA